MEKFIKDETKNLDIYNFSQKELKHILMELLRYYWDIVMLPIRRWSWNHIRMYPWIWIQKTYNTWNSKPIDFIQIIEDIKNLSDTEKNELHNIYKDEEFIARYFDMKAYLFDILDNWDLYYTDELLFLKLYKYWFLNIELFWFEHDIKGKKWVEFYSFMDNYNIKSEEFHSNKSWKTQFDIKTIIETSYKEFITHILENIIFQWDDYDQYMLSNRLDFIATIPSTKIFFENIHSLLSSYYKDSDDIKNQFIKLLNESDNILSIETSDYFHNKVQFFEYLKYLETKNKLTINKIYRNNTPTSPDCIIFEITKDISEYSLLDLINYIKLEKGTKVQYINNKILLNWEDIKFEPENSKIHHIYLLTFDTFNKFEKNHVSFNDIEHVLKLNPKKYYNISTKDLVNYDSSLRKSIQEKNKIIEKESEINKLIGINKSWISCEYYNTEESNSSVI